MASNKQRINYELHKNRYWIEYMYFQNKLFITY